MFLLVAMADVDGKNVTPRYKDFDFYDTYEFEIRLGLDGTYTLVRRISNHRRTKYDCYYNTFSELDKCMNVIRGAYGEDVYNELRDDYLDSIDGVRIAIKMLKKIEKESMHGRI